MKLFNNISNSFGKLPIFQKIAITYGGLFSISLSLISIIILTSTSIFFFKLNKRELTNISALVEVHITSGNKLTSEFLNTLREDSNLNLNIIEFDYLNSIVNVISPSKFLTYNGLEYAMFFDNKKLTDFKITEINHQKILSYETQINYNNKSYVIQISKLIHREDKQLKYIYLSFVTANFVGILISFVIGIYISKKMLHPIKNIRNIAKRITIEDLNKRIDITGPDDDLKDLALTFNDMIDRLDASFKKQNRFVSDASHELRTPIAVIQGYANLIDRWGKSDPAILQESIDSIISETEHMSTLVKKLLFLAKNDQDKLIAQKKMVDLKAICTDIAREVAVMEIKQNFEYIPPNTAAEIKIVADYNLVKQMIWILLENSIKYSDAGKTITLSTFSDKNSAFVSVKDEGCGIPEEDIPYIFDRFYRVDKSRNKDIPGTGLGLSIAQLIAKKHNAKINVFSKVSEGTQILIDFPLIEE